MEKSKRSESPSQVCPDVKINTNIVKTKVIHGRKPGTIIRIVRKQNGNELIPKQNGMEHLLNRHGNELLPHKNGHEQILQRKNGHEQLLQRKNGREQLLQRKNGNEQLLERKNGNEQLLQHKNNSTVIKEEPAEVPQIIEGETLESDKLSTDAMGDQKHVYPNGNLTIVDQTTNASQIGFYADYSSMTRNSSSSTVHKTFNPIKRSIAASDIPLDISEHSGCARISEASYDGVPSPIHEEGPSPSYTTLHSVKSEYDARAYSEPLKICTPCSPQDSDTSCERKTSLQYFSSTPSPDGSYIGVMKPSRRYRRIRPCEKFAEDYRLKRDRNNEAVKKSRMKAKSSQEQVRARYLELEEENRDLKRRLESAQRRADVAEKQKEYLQTVLASLAKPKV